jgi:predicted P-loop ATPase
VLAGDHWFHDSLGDLSSKDAAAALRGKWIIELPELAAMRKTDIESTKAFLSRTTERYRPAYGRAEVIEQRRCVFVGTTNRQDWMTDATGGRRFWPVVVGRVDIDALKHDRDQLWAEAVVLYRNGEKWWLDSELESKAAQLVMDRNEDDPWAGDVLAYAEKAAAKGVDVFARELLDHLGIERERQTPALSRRVGAILQSAGWVRSKKASRGEFKGLIPFKKSTDQSGFDFDEDR